MEATVLYSGGRDSTLAAHVLECIGYDVSLVTANFGVLDSWKHAREVAEAMGLPHEVKRFHTDVIRDAGDMILKDGFPKNGINAVHKYVVEKVAEEHDVISDGTRRDDRVPWLDLKEIRSIEDRSGAEYIAPLRGLGSRTIKKLSEKLFEIEKVESEELQNSDYESEIREMLKREHNLNLKDIFPYHTQSRVIWRS
ncbi:MAG: hypothetical protein V3R86_04410 [Candidatus Hydrothermarchaeaceae archaeon]